MLSKERVVGMFLIKCGWRNAWDGYVVVPW